MAKCLDKDAQHLTLTRVVFECFFKNGAKSPNQNLTLTSVVFELSDDVFFSSSIYDLTLTSVVFESVCFCNTIF